MVFKWIRLLPKDGEPDASGQGGDEEPTARCDKQLIDVAHEALKGDSEDPDGRRRKGRPVAKCRESNGKFKGKVRRKVWDVVRETYGPSQDSEEMTEEITERVVEVAEADPYYKKMFNGK
jgi:hypothetical protein